MISVEVRNFQSIEDVSIQIRGFTALVGRSNIGKSALVRAMKAALTNELGVDFVRHDRSTCARQKGAKSCKCVTSVHIIRGEDFNLLWQKGDSINRYTFNGKQYDRVGQGVPDFLVQEGLAPVKIGTDWETLQVADQFFPIFLLNQSGPAAAEAISDVARLDKISAAMKLADRDKREIQATRKVRGQDVLGLEVKLETYQGLDAACARADLVETSLAAIEMHAERIEDLSGYISTTQSLVSEVKGLAEVVRAKAPSFDLVQSHWQMVQDLTRLQGQLIEVGGAYRNLSSIKVGDLPELEPVTDGIARVRLLSGWIGKLRSLRGSFETLAGVETLKVPQVPPTADLRERVKALLAFESRLSAVLGAVGRLEQDMKTLNVEESEVQAQVDELGVCPTCSQPLVSHRHV